MQNTKYKLEHGLRFDLIWRTELNLLLQTSLNRLFVRLWKMERVEKEKNKSKNKGWNLFASCAKNKNAKLLIKS